MTMLSQSHNDWGKALLANNFNRAAQHRMYPFYTNVSAFSTKMYTFPLHHFENTLNIHTD